MICPLYSYESSVPARMISRVSDLKMCDMPSGSCELEGSARNLKVERESRVGHPASWRAQGAPSCEQTPRIGCWVWRLNRHARQAGSFTQLARRNTHVRKWSQEREVASKSRFRSYLRCSEQSRLAWESQPSRGTPSAVCPEKSAPPLGLAARRPNSAPKTARHPGWMQINAEGSPG